MNRIILTAAKVALLAIIAPKIFATTLRFAETCALRWF